MSKSIVALLGKDFEFIRIEKVNSKNPILFVEEGKVSKCKIAIKKLGIKTIYTTTKSIEYLSDPVFKDITTLSVHLGTVDFSPIQHLTHLKQLSLMSSAYDLDGVRIPEVDLGNLKKLTSLLCAIPNPIVNLHQLTKLTKLNITEYKEKDLSAFEKLANLKELYLYESSCTSLKGIESLIKLNKLTIEGAMHLKSISEIANLENLKTLEISATQVTDISFLSSLQKLEKLTLSVFEKIEDSASIATLSNLEELSLLYIKHIDNLSFLLDLNTLKKLYLEPWSVHPSDGKYLPLTQKLNSMGALRQIIEWEDIYEHLDEEGRKIHEEYFEVSDLQFIRREFSFHQYEDYSEPYTKENCDSIDKVIYQLIDNLETNEDATAETKLDYFIDAIVQLDEIDLRIPSLIETGEREYLYETLEDIAAIVEIDLEKMRYMKMPKPSNGGILTDFFDEDN